MTFSKSSNSSRQVRLSSVGPNWFSWASVWPYLNTRPVRKDSSTDWSDVLARAVRPTANSVYECMKCCDQVWICENRTFEEFEEKKSMNKYSAKVFKKLILNFDMFFFKCTCCEKFFDLYCFSTTNTRSVVQMSNSQEIWNCSLNILNENNLPQTFPNTVILKPNSIFINASFPCLKRSDL